MSELGFSGTKAASVVGISYRQLDYWARTDLIRPSLTDATGSGSRRTYSYRDLLELRVKGALPRMEALKNVVDQHGVNFMATICAICKAQFSKVLPYYGFDMGMVGGVHQLVSKSIRLGEPN